MKRQVMLSEFNQSHMVLLKNWLGQPHVKRWYPDPDSNLEWAACPPENGSQALIEVDSKPVGYIRWQLVSREVLDSLGLTQIPSNSADVDILIGEEPYTSQGVGPVALSALISSLREQEGIPTIGLTTSNENTTAHKAFTKSGFKKIAEYSPEGFGKCFLFSLSLNQ